MLLLKDIIIILMAAVIMIIAATRLKIPPIIGFLLTGIIIGPFGFKLVDNSEGIQFIAEMGIIILMFTIGLEFSISKVKELKKNFILFGGSQVIISWAVFSSILYIYGFSFAQAFFTGFLFSLSSTAIVLKLFQENKEINTPAGLKTTSILLFQDAAIIPALIAVPIFFSGGSNSGNVFNQIALPVGGVILIFFGSRFFVPKIFNSIVNARVPELLMVSIFVLLFGTAFLTHEIGASFAIGAFIAGMAIADSDFVHQINTEIIPSKNIFNSIFFISIGMFVNLDFLFSNLHSVILITFLIIFIKAALIILIFKILKYPLSEGLYTALALAHVGEFAFILLSLLQGFSLYSSYEFNMLLSATILSMFTIPFLIMLGKKVSGVSRFKQPVTETKSRAMANHTIIAGFGINGQNIARILKTLGIPYSILDLNPRTVQKFKALHEPIFYGDIDRDDNLKNIGADKASLMIIAISDMAACKRSINMAKKINPSIKIIARANFLTEVDKMYKLGADLVLSQDMETSLVFINHILKFYNLPDHIARVQTNLLRKEHYRFFVKDDSREKWKVAIFDYIEQDNEFFFVSNFSNHVSRKLSDLAPFHFENIKIIGIIRQNKIITESLADLIIEKFDTLIFSGNHKKTFEAITWMEENN